MSYSVPVNRTRTSRDARSIPYNWQRSDALIQDKILHPDSVRAVMEILQKTGGALAYTPEMQAIIMEVLQRRFETDIGNDIFVPPNYALYEDPEMAAFYGVDTSEVNNIQTRFETFNEQRDRLVRETAREVEFEMPGLSQVMENFRKEDWARYGIAEESPYIHADPDITLFRNPGRGWSSMDIAVSTSDKGNTIEYWDALPNYVFPRAHPGWEVDVPGGYWDSLN